MKFLNSSLMLLSLLPFTVNANSETRIDNENRSEPMWWMNLGIGAGTGAHGISGLASQFSFNGRITKNLFLTLYNNYLGHQHDNEYYYSWNDDREIRDTGLLLGLIKRHPRWYWSTSAGLSYCSERRKDYYSTLYSYGYTTKYHGALGVPVQGQLFWTPFKHVGFGLIGQVVASENAYAAAMLAIQLYN